MKCLVCGRQCLSAGETTTLVGYGYFVDDQGRKHDHDDNCLKRRYKCECGEKWIESKRRTCGDRSDDDPPPIAGCDWKGKGECDCHSNLKVDEWTDTEVLDREAGIKALLEYD